MANLDRIVDLQTKAITRDNLGGEVEHWVSVAKLWANVRVTGVRERYLETSDRQQALRDATIRIRWRSDIRAADHRIVYDDWAWDILGQDEVGYRRFLDLTCRAEIAADLVTIVPVHVMGGLSTDQVPEATEITIGHSQGRITFEPFTDRYVILWRAADEPDITAVVFQDDLTSENQVGGWTQYSSTVTVNSIVGNVWVSNQLLTFPEQKVLEVG